MGAASKGPSFAAPKVSTRTHTRSHANARARGHASATSKAQRKIYLTVHPKCGSASDAYTNIDTDPTHAQSMGLCVRGLPNVCVPACLRACLLVNQPGSRDTTLRRRSCVPSRTRRRSCVLVNMRLRVQVHEGGLFQVKPRHRCRGGDSRCMQHATCDVGHARNNVRHTAHAAEAAASPLCATWLATCRLQRGTHRSMEHGPKTSTY
jgi:hypothetical protein